MRALFVSLTIFSSNRNYSYLFIVHIVEFFQNVESTGKLEISLDVLNNDALLKKLNESTISIHTVEIHSTCKVDQVLKKFGLPSCVKVLRIRENSMNFEDMNDLLKYLRSVNNLHELDLCRTKFNESTFFIFISALNYCKDLTSLILTDNSLTEQEINGLITVFESMKKIKNLNLCNCILTEIQANALLHKHKQAKNIVSLDLSHNAIQGNEIVVWICQLQLCQELDLSHNRVRFSPLPNLTGKRNHLSTCLKVISLSSNCMKPEDISQFCSLIRSDVLKLNLDCNHIGHSIWSLCSLSERIKHLKVLSLANTNVCDNVYSLVFLLSLVRELEDLNLSSNNLMAEDFQQLQAPLSKLTQLKKLNLSMNAIGPDGMKVLTEIFKEFPLLERLDMNSSCIREDEVNVLCKSLVSLKKLKYLNLSGNITDIEVLDNGLVLPSTLEELLFSDVIHGQKLFDEIRRLQNLRKLHLKPKLRRCDVDALVNMLLCFPKLEELSLADASLEELFLTISDTHAIYERLFCAIKLLKRLRKLSLGGVRVPGGVNAFIGMLSSLSILEDIVFPDLSLIDADSVTSCFKALISLGNLRSLDLRSTEICTESTSGALACVLPSLQLLEKLRLRICFINGESERKLFAALGKLKNLKELLICGTRLESINALAEVLPSLQLLEKADLYISIPDGRNKLLFDALEKLRYLKEFPYCAGIRNAEVEAFAHALVSLPLLEKLEFSTILLNTEYVGQLYAAIGKLKYLRKFHLLIFNTNANSEVEALAEVLPSLELLEELELRWDEENELDSEHKKQLFAAMSKLRYLKRLNFNCNYIPESYYYFEGLGKMLTSLRLLEKLELMGLKFKDESEKKELLIAVGKLKYLKELELRWEKITQTNVDDLVRTLEYLQVLEEFTLWVRFYCKHDCDDHRDVECAHYSDDDCDDECNHNCYDDSCNKCRHDEYKRLRDLVKTKVLSAVAKLKFFKKFELDIDDITEQARKAST